MKKESFYRLLSKSSLLFVLTISFFYLSAQPKPPTKPTVRPYMWIGGGEGESHRNNFKSEKLKRMAANNNTPSLNTNLYLGKFWRMIRYKANHPGGDLQYLHVYLGINDNKQVVLMFGFAEKLAEDEDLVCYKFSDDKDFDTLDLGSSIVKPDEKRRWTENFFKAMYLTTTEQNDPYNKYPNDTAPGKVPSDTKFVTYCWQDVLDLLNAQEYFVSQHENITDDFRAFLGAYSKTAGCPRGRFKGKYKNRIVLHFQFLESGKTDVDLASFNGFPTKARTKSLCDGFEKLVSTADNGQLCPVNCR